MASNHSELDGDEPDLSGLVESIVDSDEEDDLAESMDVRLYLLCLVTTTSQLSKLVASNRTEGSYENLSFRFR